MDNYEKIEEENAITGLFDSKIHHLFNPIL